MSGLTLRLHYMPAIHVFLNRLISCIFYSKDLNSTEGLTGKDTRYVKYNGALGPQQIKWLDRKLAKAEESGQKVIIVSQYSPSFMEKLYSFNFHYKRNHIYFQPNNENQ